MNPANNNPPVTAASVAAAINACVLAFLNLPDNQEAAICGVVVVAAAVVAQRFTTPVANIREHH